MKMIERSFLAVAIVALFFGSSACLTPILMSDASAPVAGRAYQDLGDTQGESCSMSVLGIPVATDASLRTALADAKTRVGADALIEIVVDRWSLLTFVFNKQCTQVNAKGIRFGDGVVSTPVVPALPAVPVAPAASLVEPDVAKPVAEAKPAPSSEPVAPAQPVKVDKPLTRAEKRKAKAEERRRKREEARKAKAESRKAKADARKAKAEARKREKEEAKARKEEAKAKAKAERKAAEDAKMKAAQEAKRKKEEAKAKAAAERKAAEEAKRLAEEAKPVPDAFKVFCKYKTGQAVLVETKSAKLEVAFDKCLHNGLRVKKADGALDLVPFDQIWTVSPRSNVAPIPPSTPAQPAKPARSGPATPKNK